MIVSRRFRSLSPLLLVSTSATAMAQVPTPEPSATLPPIIYSLPGTPTPAASATPAATPVPVETSVPVAGAPRGVPTPRASPTARATPVVRATPPPEPRPTSTAREAAARAEVGEPAAATVPSAVIEPLATPTATSVAPAPATEAPATTPAPMASSDTPGAGWYLPLGIVLALAAGGAWLWQRRRRSDEDATAASSEPEIAPDPPVRQRSGVERAVATPAVAEAAPRMLSRRSTVAAPPPAAVDLRAWIELELRPRRAGLNLLTATADVELLVRNRGGAEATNVRIDARLTSARSNQDAELGQVFAETQGRLAAPAFTLAPGGERVVRALVTLPRDAINVLTAAGRPMFVPVVTLNARYTPGGEGAGEGQTAQAFALGIERADSAKLAPFWLDTPSRMVESVAARPHALSIAS